MKQQQPETIQQIHITDTKLATTVQKQPTIGTENSYKLLN